MSGLSDLEPTASFNCTSGILAWGQLDCVLGAKRKLNKGLYKFDAIRGQSSTIQSVVGDERGDATSTPSPVTNLNFIGHRYRCRALTGKWHKYEHTLSYVSSMPGDDHFNQGDFKLNGRNIFLCHESYTPDEVARKGATVGFSWKSRPDMNGEVIYVNCYDWGERHEPRLSTWKGRSDDVILVDPAWKVDVPAKNRDWKSDPKTTEELMAILNAGHEDTDGNVQLLDAQGNCCGLLCKDFNGSGDIYARLVFNQERHLVGMCVFDDVGRQLYREDGTDLSEDEDDVTVDSTFDYTSSSTDYSTPSDRTLSSISSASIYFDSDDSYLNDSIPEADEEKPYEYFEDFVGWLAEACSVLTIE